VIYPDVFELHQGDVGLLQSPIAQRLLAYVANR